VSPSAFSPGPAAHTRRVPWINRAVAWGVSLRTRQITRPWKQAGGDLHSQERVWSQLITLFSKTAFGKVEGITPGMSYTDFQANLPLRAYESFAPWIEQMKRGDANVLWPGRCQHYAVSSGTTAGRTKYLPITPAMLAHFRQTGLDSLCYYTRRVGHSEVFRGKHLFLGGSTTLSRLESESDFSAWCGDLSGITALNLPAWVEHALYEPGREIAQLGDWPKKLRAIVEKTVPENITLIAGIPSWLLILAEEIRARTGKAPLRAVWPRLECLIHGGVPLGPFASQLREAFGEGVNFHEVYPASEGFIAAQDDDPAAGMRLMTRAGIFYEFLPLEKYDEERLAELVKATVPLAGVKIGVDYVLVMTTPAGLCRYVIGDVVRFVSTEPPRLVYAGRTRLQLSAFGEHVIEKELTDVLSSATQHHGLVVGNFHVAPRFIESSDGTGRGRHHWLIELKSGASVDLSALTQTLDAGLQRANDDYEAKRLGGGLQAPEVTILPDGSFERWMRKKSKWGGQNKMPRCRSDRQIADELVDAPP